jgi:hypothetical protein
METIVGIAIWAIIFLVWYVKTYPEKFRRLNIARDIKGKWPRKKRSVRAQPGPGPGLRPKPKKDFKALVEAVESLSERDRMDSSDAAAMVAAVKQLMEIEPASGQLWEALALDSLETAEIICDECKVPVEKTVKKTGVKIQCKRCRRWLALRNSKVTIIDPKRADLEDWEQ